MIKAKKKRPRLGGRWLLTRYLYGGKNEGGGSEAERWRDPRRKGAESVAGWSRTRKTDDWTARDLEERRRHDGSHGEGGGREEEEKRKRKG